MFPKRRIIESDSEEEKKDINIIQKDIKKEINEKSKITCSTNSIKTTKETITIESDEEWDSKECSEIIHGKCDDNDDDNNIGPIPIKIIGEQLGDDGIEYDVIFQVNKSNGRITKYNDWIPEKTLTKRMLILKKEYDNLNNIQNINMNVNNKKNQNEKQINYASESDNEIVINVKNINNKEPPKTDEDVLCAPRRSSRSSGTRKSMTRQKLNDLMDLRNRSKSGLGGLQFDDQDDNEEDDNDIEEEEVHNYKNNNNISNNDNDYETDEQEGEFSNSYYKKNKNVNKNMNNEEDSDFEISKPKSKTKNNSRLKHDESKKFDHYSKDKLKNHSLSSSTFSTTTTTKTLLNSRKQKRNIQDIYDNEEYNNQDDEYIDEKGYISDDIENFIVGDDLGEEELYDEDVLEERRRKKARRKQKLIAKKKKESRKHKREYNSDDDNEQEEDDDDDDDNEVEYDDEDKQNKRHKSIKNSKHSVHNVKKKGRMIIKEEEEEEENDDDNEEEYEVNFSEDNENNSSDEDDDDDEDGGGRGGPDYSLYRRLENMNEELEETTPIIFRQPMSLPEAMTIYIDMMSKILTLDNSTNSSSSTTTTTTSSGFPKTPAKSSAYHRPNIKMTSDLKTALRKIEGLICTSRESLLGSSAWKGEFYEQLKSRPFYTVVESHRDGDGVCDACSRVSGGAVYSVYLYGPTYDSSRIWDNQHWIEYLPKEILPTSTNDLLSSPGISSSVARVSLRDNTPEKDNNNNGMKGKEWWKKSWPIELTREKETRWSVTSHCMRRTQLYHTLLHYKFRLLLKVKTKLERNHYNTKAVTEDTDFISCETERFQRLITSAGQKYGGEEQSKFTLWSDDEKDESTISVEKSIKKSSSSSTNPSQYYPPLKITSRSPHKSKLNSGTLDQWIFQKKK